MSADARERLQAFVADEEAAAARDEAGRYWPSNHHLLAPLAARADTWLAGAELQRFFRHWLRRSGSVPAVGPTGFEALREAYRALGPASHGLALLYCFGFDARGAIGAGETADAAALAGHRQWIERLARFTSLPGQHAKAAKLRQHDPNGARALQVLRHVRYREGPLDPYEVSDLTYWGLVLLALLDPGSRVALLHDLLDDGYALPHRAAHHALLHDTVQAARPHATDDAEFAALAARLAAAERERRASCESVAWARALALAFAEEDDWQVLIAIPQQGNARSPLIPPTLMLTLHPRPDAPWHLLVRDAQQRHYSERAGRVAQDDIGLPALERLDAFPQWLQRLAQEHALVFERARAQVQCGRHRAAARRIAQWLGDA